MVPQVRVDGVKVFDVDGVGRRRVVDGLPDAQKHPRVVPFDGVAQHEVLGGRFELFLQLDLEDVLVVVVVQDDLLPIDVAFEHRDDKGSDRVEPFMVV